MPEARIPNQEAALGVSILPVSPIPPTLEPIEPPVSEEKPGLIERIRGLWIVLERFVEEAIQAAEVIHGPGSGDTKKRFVTSQALLLLKQFEERANLIPNWIEPIVFMALEKALFFMIERVLGSLKLAGKIPA